MSQKTAFVDYWALAKSFKIGDTVALWGFPDSRTINIPGTVTAVHPGIGFLDVEFPWGNQRVSSEEVLLVNDDFAYVSPQYDTGYKSWDKDMARKREGYKGYSYALPKTASVIDTLASEYNSQAVLANKLACQCKCQGVSEIDAYTTIASTSGLPDHHIRTAVFYTYSAHTDEYAELEKLPKKASKRYEELRGQGMKIKEAIRQVLNEYKKTAKTAIYWTAPGRKYRMDKGEIDDGLPNCPKCEANLQKTNYKKHTKLFICPQCLFCIKPSDIEGLPGHVEESGFGVGPGEEEDLITAALHTELNAFKASLDKENSFYTEAVFSSQPLMTRRDYGITGSKNITSMDVRNTLGSDGIKLIYEEVKDGSTSPVIVEQFMNDFEKHGFQDAVFFLSAKTADGLFDRNAYNRLVEALEHTRARIV